jgi:hypothetical protein
MTTTDLERERRQVQRDLDKLEAPQRTRDLLIAKRERLSEQIAAAQAAQEAERLAEQKRENEVASLQREWGQLQRVYEYPAKGKTLEGWLWSAYQVRGRLARHGVTVEPFTVDPLEAVKPLVAAQERAAAVTREMFDRGRASLEQERAAHHRHTLTTELLAEGLDQEQATRIAELVADEGMELDAARQQVLGANEGGSHGSETME